MSLMEGTGHSADTPGLQDILGRFLKSIPHSRLGLAMGQHQLGERLIHFQELESPRELCVSLVLFNYPTGWG